MNRRLIELISGHGKPKPKAVWESKYLKGKYDSLKKLGGLAHYSVIAGYFHYLKNGGSILDVGCGDGLLQSRLNLNGYSYYLGIDISDTAITRASSKSNNKTFFFREDAMKFVPKERFDAIIFNENLMCYYDPLAILKKYQNYLKKDGLFIVSMIVNNRNFFIWKRLKNKFTTLDETKIKNKNGLRWICKVLNPS